MDVIRQESSFVLDTGIWISYIEKENANLTSFLQKNVFHETSEKKIYGNTYLLAEIGYILCRIHGVQTSKETVSEIQSAIIHVNPDKIFRMTAEIKCHFPISLCDCFSIATGKYQNCPIIFKPEEELSEKRIKTIEEKFGVEIYLFSG